MWHRSIWSRVYRLGYHLSQYAEWSKLNHASEVYEKLYAKNYRCFVGIYCLCWLC